MSTWVQHDYLQVNGGAERLVITLAAGLPDTRLATSGVYPDFRQTGDLKRLAPYVPVWPQMLPRIPRALAIFSTNSVPVRHGDTVIYSGLFAPLAALGDRAARRIYYCHTPPGFAFNRRDQYLSRAPRLARPALSLAFDRYRGFYLQALGRMDVVVANSANIATKLDQLGFAAEIVHPPIDLDGFRWIADGDYYLSVGRLEPNKRIDLIVSAFLAMPHKKLVVVSGGSQLPQLRALATGAPNIIILGWQTDSQLADWIGRARAIIYIPRDEDFGMSAVEAMAAGKPVIAAREGGLRETIIDGKTGLLIDPTLANLQAAVQRLDRKPTVFTRSACEARAALYSTPRFLWAMARLVYP